MQPHRRNYGCWEPGVYGITNTHLDDVWPKSERGIAALTAIAAAAGIDNVLKVLRDESADFVSDGHEPESARRATPAFLRGKEYGTRACTAVMFDGRRIEFAEQLYGPMGRPGARVTEMIGVRQPQVRSYITADESALSDPKRGAIARPPAQTAISALIAGWER